MLGAAVGKVVRSRVPEFVVGDYVTTMLGWALNTRRGRAERFSEDRCVARSPSTFLNALGTPGLTAWTGLFKVANLKQGKPFRSAAAGAVGSIACQLAKTRGCRVIGSAGSSDKCEWLTEVAGVDSAINYKSGNLQTASRERSGRNRRLFRERRWHPSRSRAGQYENVGADSGLRHESNITMTSSPGRPPQSLIDYSEDDQEWKDFSSVDTSSIFRLSARNERFGSRWQDSTSPRPLSPASKRLKGIPEPVLGAKMERFWSLSDDFGSNRRERDASNRRAHVARMASMVSTRMSAWSLLKTSGAGSQDVGAGTGGADEHSGMASGVDHVRCKVRSRLFSEPVLYEFNADEKSAPSHLRSVYDRPREPRGAL